jgi:hypothetical protein
MKQAVALIIVAAAIIVAAVMITKAINGPSTVQNVNPRPGDCSNAVMSQLNVNC